MVIYCRLLVLIIPLIRIKLRLVRVCVRVCVYVCVHVCACDIVYHNCYNVDSNISRL